MMSWSVPVSNAAPVVYNYRRFPGANATTTTTHPQQQGVVAVVQTARGVPAPLVFPHRTIVGPQGSYQQSVAATQPAAPTTRQQQPVRFSP